MKRFLFLFYFISGYMFGQISESFNISYGVERIEDVDYQQITNIEARQLLASRLAQLPKVLSELNVCNGDYVFKLREQLEINNEISKAANLTGGAYIFCRKDSIHYKQSKSFGSKLNILLPKNYYDNWQITDDKKSILGFKCIKAITYKEVITKDLERTNQLITAWFTPEINIQAGPQGLDNLPGLVLEGSINGIYNFVAKAINDEGCSGMEVPDGGKFISEEAYQKKISEILKDIKNRG